MRLESDGNQIRPRTSAPPPFSDAASDMELPDTSDPSNETDPAARIAELESQLRESQERFRATFEEAGVGIAHLAVDGRWLQVNRALCEMTGYSKEDLLARTYYDVIDSHDVQAVITHARQLLAGEQLREALELRCVRGDGEVRWLSLSLSLVRLDDAPHYFLAVLDDITERRQIEEERAQLLRSEQHARERAEQATHELRALQSITDTALAHLTLDDLLRDVLARLCEVVEADSAAIWLRSDDGKTLHIRATLGYERVDEGWTIPFGQGFVGRIISTRSPIVIDDVERFDLFHADFRHQVRSLAGVPIVLGQRVLGVAHVGCKTLHTFGERDLRLLRLAADRIAYAIDHAELYEVAQTARDIAEIRASQLEAFFDTIADMVIVYDAEGRMVRINATGRKLMGEELPVGPETPPIGEWGPEYQPHDEQGRPLPYERWPITRVLRGETLTGANVGELRVRRPDGQILELSTSGAPVTDSQGRVTGAVFVYRDVAERRRLEAERAHLLSVVSHELKTPLTSVKLRGQLLARYLSRGDIEQAVAFVDQLEEDVERLNRLVNDLLDAARIERGRIDLALKPYELKAMCLSAAREQAEATGRTVTVDVPEGDVRVKADGPRIQQVLVNLLSNALKYSPPERPVSLSLSVGDGLARIAVRDEGQGVPPESIPHLFDRFYRVPGVLVQSGAGVGLGLGLYICKTIIERHGGTIDVDSRVGEGSTFWFTLPFPTAEAE